MPLNTFISRPKITTDVSVAIDVSVFEERTTIVHCTLLDDALIRIWPDTYLLQQNGVRKPMVQAFGISPHPHWQLARTGHRFTLVFEGLEKDCSFFDVVENIPEPGGFKAGPLSRNDTDVYWLEVSAELE